MVLLKLVAIDLDDTLLRKDLLISERAKKAIKEAQRRGVEVTLATGRMYKSALPYALDLGLNLPLITYQGALVKYADGREVYHRPIPLTIARELVDFLHSCKIHVNVYINDELFMEGNSAEGEKYVAIARVPVHYVDNFTEILTVEPSKIVAIGDSQQLELVEKKMRRLFESKINITRSKPYFLELSNLEATKGQALQALTRSMGLEAQNVMAIGDSYNDLDMIMYAGMGVAMENAMPEVKQYADYITGSNDDDGVAEAIEKFILS